VKKKHVLHVFFLHVAKSFQDHSLTRADDRTGSGDEALREALRSLTNGIGPGPAGFTRYLLGLGVVQLMCGFTPT
jgi:hypothetical protein